MKLFYMRQLFRYPAHECLRDGKGSKNVVPQTLVRAFVKAFNVLNVDHKNNTHSPVITFTARGSQSLPAKRDSTARRFRLTRHSGIQSAAHTFAALGA